jgi:anti-anti-sigma regulatory factor
VEPDPHEQPPEPPGELGSSGQPRTIVVVVPASLDSSSARRLHEHAADLIERVQPEVITCDVAAAIEPDLLTLEVLARLQLAARRAGRSIRLEHAPPALVALIEFTGLSCALPGCTEGVASATSPAQRTPGAASAVPFDDGRSLSQ